MNKDDYMQERALKQSKPAEHDGTNFKPTERASMPKSEAPQASTEWLDELTSLLTNELREYHEKYPDANYMDLSGYIVGFMKRPQTKAAIQSHLDDAVLAELKKLREKMTLFPPNGIYEASMFAITVNDLDDRIYKLRQAAKEKIGQ